MVVKLKYFVVAACALACLAPRIIRAQDAVFLSNIAQAVPGDTTPVGVASAPTQQFITGVNPGGYLLTSIQLLFAPPVGEPSGFILSLLGDSGDRPGGTIATLVGSSVPVDGLFTYTVGSPITLEPDTAYWVKGSAFVNNFGNDFEWAGAETSDATSSDGWSIGSDFGDTGFPTLAIDATPVPEPSTISFLLAGGLAAYLFRRRR
jgi:hypothetical protein